LVNFERAERFLGRRFLDARRVEDEERNWSLQGQRGKGVARFATGRSVDFFSAGPRYFLRPYLNLRARTYLSVVRAPAPAPGPFMRKMSVTRTTINPQFSCPLPAFYSRARFQVFFFFAFFLFRQIRSFRERCAATLGEKIDGSLNPDHDGIAFGEG